MKSVTSNVTVAIRNATVFLVIAGLFLAVVEGLGSIAAGALEMLRGSSTSAPVRYDSLVGWVGIESAHIPDFYGPGNYVRTDSRGFRSDTELEETAPSGRIRIICSGDSFTYGQGVANDRTWCHRISVLDDRFETVNMGLPGYGVDQMYLRYLRDGSVLEHSIHIFAFIEGDLTRMAYREQHGYGKPVLVLDQGELVPDNMPVPRLRWSVTRVLRRVDLRSVDLARRAFARLAPEGGGLASLVETHGPVASEVFRTVQRLASERGVVPLFVLLPTWRDVGRDVPWRPWLAVTMDELDLPFVDLTSHLRGVPAGEAASFFIPESLPGGGHYSNLGNQWVAELLYAHLTEVPEVRGLLADRR